MYDASTGGLARVRLQLNSDPSDNPMASEIAGHIGGKGNHFRWKCVVGGTMLEKEMDAGYHDLFSVSYQSVSAWGQLNTIPSLGNHGVHVKLLLVWRRSSSLHD